MDLDTCIDIIVAAVKVKAGPGAPLPAQPGDRPS